MEHNIIHRDISHSNIFVQAEDFKGKEEEEFKVTEHCLIFINEIIKNKKRNTMHMNNEPLHYRTGTPKFITRSPAIDCLLADDIKFPKSVFWCIVVFLLLAIPLGSALEDPMAPMDPNKFGLNHAWKCIANHEISSSNNGLDNLAAQIRPKWGLIEPAPHILHLHKVMQQIILEYIDLWKTQKKDVRLTQAKATVKPAWTEGGIPSKEYELLLFILWLSLTILWYLGHQTMRQGTSSYNDGTFMYNKGVASYKEVPQSLPPLPHLFKGCQMTRQGMESYEDTGSYKEVPQSLPPLPCFITGGQLPLESSLDMDIFAKSLPSTLVSLSTGFLPLSPTFDVHMLDTDTNPEA
ncbi:hypothetical protein BDN71DRAFT_1433937 [Pleurotus eryngii]|uniref:Uncharacterized protein n=1 Tax=Pleurotus eryngii TaxID=5323 RepID=A0A9P5ZSD8_PLEER|nr:hypothetical protein BDN71DRAFT_1433937 [Pleurotus eryngii]